MRFTFYGHAAFGIETGGVKLILDPYRSPDAGGYAPIDEPADLVVVSHENDRYHSHLGQIVPPFEVLRALDWPKEGVQTHGIQLRSMRVYESPEKRPEDVVTVIILESEGLRVAFLGDLGHSLDESELLELRGADVVLAPVGGPPTIELHELVRLLADIQPRVIIPMHYLTPRINLKLLPRERFLKLCPGWPMERTGASTLTIDRNTMDEGPRVVCLEPSR